MGNISRRAFMRSSVACGIGAGVAGCISGRQDGGNKETRYIAAYDTESGGCLAACQKIVEVHRRFDMPATFFIVGKTLEANPKEYLALLDDPLFEIASHTYSHRMLRNNDFCGAAVSKEQKREEIFKGKEASERVFERRCVGLRPGCGFDNGFQGDPEVLGYLREAGIESVDLLTKLGLAGVAVEARGSAGLERLRAYLQRSAEEGDDFNVVSAFLAHRFDRYGLSDDGHRAAIDVLAAVRFASVFLDFSSPSDYEAFFTELPEAKAGEVVSSAAAPTRPPGPRR